MSTKDKRIDAYIAKAAPFARPILTRYREIVHKACPAVEERIKWGVPHFDYNGGMMTAMAAFKAHASIGFWLGKEVLGAEFQGSASAAAGHFGRLTSVNDLPTSAKMTGFIKKAMKLNDAGVKMKRPVKKAKAPLKMPSELSAALAANKKATATWEAFAPSHKREYIEWIIEAKAEATRDRRLEQAIEWIAEGKQRNWKYQR
jgi:uncharacterized protein YdeI (YjbR/CyaY-like superfamily)